ncbi:MAG: hypothetical protein ABF812_06435, partial [Gluconobacter cerinus]|uniref:hypothetical protein n=1 Tax=Gluconobacter cerinus TaxID=38307 RepID=UPI0039EBDED0
MTAPWGKALLSLRDPALQKQGNQMLSACIPETLLVGEALLGCLYPIENRRIKTHNPRKLRDFL